MLYREENVCRRVCKEEICTLLDMPNVGVEVLREADSTNKVAAEYLKKGAVAPFAILAIDQSAGRGRLNRKWFGSPHASIMMSVVVEVPKIAELAESYTVRAGLDVCDKLSELCGAELYLKWPNDIYSRDGRKLAGMLAELDINGGKNGYNIIFGIGLNYDFSSLAPTDIPEDIRGTCGDLKTYSSANPYPCINMVAAAIIESAVEASQERLLASLPQHFARRDWLLGKEVNAVSVNDEYCGTACGIDERGALKISLPDGSVRVLTGGEATIKK